MFMTSQNNLIYPRDIFRSLHIYAAINSYNISLLYDQCYETILWKRHVGYAVFLFVVAASQILIPVMHSARNSRKHICMHNRTAALTSAVAFNAQHYIYMRYTQALVIFFVYKWHSFRIRYGTAMADLFNE